MTPRRASVTPPRSKSIYSNGVVMSCHTPARMSSRRTGRYYLSHRERSKSSFMISGEGSRTARGDGFSLVELSIVLVILGLLVGGILAGQSLIRAAELRSVSTELQKYQSSVGAFSDKYASLPGDMPDATAVWGEAHATLATCKTTAGTGTQTCNGNGDGLVGLSPSLPSDWYETYLFWEHLANARLIEGAYTGIISGGGSYHITIGTNAPRSRISNAGWMMQSAGLGLPWYTTNRDHTFQIGTSSNASSNTWTSGAILTPQEAWNIDTKTDDGKPGTGKVMGFAMTSCTTTDVAATAEYELTTNSIECSPLFKAEF
jgi:prepilin-type N-terminal cleavage/methylation domain-containing protein